MTPSVSEYLKNYRELSAVLEAWRNGRFWYTDKTRLTRGDLWIKRTNMMEHWVSKHLHTPVVTLGDAMLHPTWNLIGSVTKQKAVAFRERPVVELVDTRTRQAVSTVDYPVAGRIGYLLEDGGVFEALESLESILIPHQTAGIWLRIVDGEVVATALPPYCLDVEGHPVLRGDLRRLRAVTVPLIGDAYPDDPEHETRVTYRRDPATGRILAGYVDPEGNPIPVDLPEAPEGVYPGRRMPVVIWRETASSSTWMAPLPHALHSAQYQLNVYLSQMALAYRMGTYALAVAKQSAGAGEFPSRDAGDFTTVAGIQDALTSAGTPSQAVRDTRQIRVSGDMTDVVQLTPGWELDLLQARVAIADFTSYVETMLKLAYLQEDLPPTQVDLSHLQPSNVGESSKLVNHQPLESAKQLREGRLARQTVETLRVWRDLHNRVCDPEDRIPLELDFRVRFESVWSPGILTNQSAMQAIQEGIKAGVVDPVKMRSSLQGVTEDEAAADWARTLGRLSYAQGTQSPTG